MHKIGTVGTSLITNSCHHRLRFPQDPKVQPHPLQNRVTYPIWFSSCPHQWGHHPIQALECSLSPTVLQHAYSGGNLVSISFNFSSVEAWHPFMWRNISNPNMCIVFIFIPHMHSTIVRWIIHIFRPFCLLDIQRCGKQRLHVINTILWHSFSPA